MIVEIGNGKDGLKEYLETGKKKGRELHRNELDQRVPLFGDLDAFELATLAHGGGGTRYNHITLSFTESYVSDEMLQTAVNEFREYALSAWPESERHRIAFYAEAHRPRLLRYMNAAEGNDVVRLTHIHIGLGRHDLANGKAVDAFGYLGNTENLKYIDAWQESFNAKYGFSSPKDNPKITPENAIDVLARYTGHKPDTLGNFNERKNALELDLQKAILAGNVTTWEDFAKLLSRYGEVSKVNEGKFGECYRIKPTASGRAMRLKGVFFQRDFIERPTVVKTALIEQKARAAYLEQMQPRKEPAYVARILAEWTTVKARENRYLHTDSKFYKEVYLPSDADGRFKILNQIESNNHGIPSSFSATNRKTSLARSRLPGLRVRDLDGIQRRSEMLLRSDAGMDVSAQSIARSNGSELRQADGIDRGSSGSVSNGERAEGVGAGLVKSGRTGRGTDQGANNGLDHVAQPSSIIGRMHADLLDRYEQAADKERYAEIRRNLDGMFLLKSLSHSHGVNVDLYQVTSAKDGSVRIQCGSRALSPSDFLKVELGLPWKEAAPILRRAYEQQIGKAVISPRGKVAASPLWQQFKDGRTAAQIVLRERLGALTLNGKTRYAALARSSADEKKRDLAGLTGVSRKAALSLAVLRSATLKDELTATLSIERQSLRETIFPAQTVGWRLFLQQQARAGNEEALAALRKIDDTARTTGPSITGTIQLDDEDELQRKRRLLAQGADRSVLNMLAHAVERNGDITYRHNGEAVLRDEGLNIAVLDPNSDAAIEAGLLIGQQKFGAQLSLTGSAEFQQRVVAVAVAQGIAIRFVDPQLEAIRQQLAQEKISAARTPVRRPKQDLAANHTSRNETVKRDVEAAPVETRKSPAAPAQLAVAPTAKAKKRAAKPVAADPQVRQPLAVAPLAPTPASVSAHDWLATWAGETGKAVAVVSPGDGKTLYTVEYVAADGVVVNKGLSGSVYTLPDALILRVGDRVLIGKNSQVRIASEIEPGKNKLER